MMTEERIREYLEEAVTEIKRAVAWDNQSVWAVRCEKLWTLEFVLEETAKPKYIHPEDRFPFPAKTQEAAR